MRTLFLQPDRRRPIQSGIVANGLAGSGRDRASPPSDFLFQDGIDPIRDPAYRGQKPVFVVGDQPLIMRQFRNRWLDLAKGAEPLADECWQNNPCRPGKCKIQCVPRIGDLDCRVGLRYLLNPFRRGRRAQNPRPWGNRGITGIGGKFDATNLSPGKADPVGTAVSHTDHRFASPDVDHPVGGNEPQSQRIIAGNLCHLIAKQKGDPKPGRDLYQCRAMRVLRRQQRQKSLLQLFGFCQEFLAVVGQFIAPGETLEQITTQTPFQRKHPPTEGGRAFAGDRSRPA